MSYMQWLHALDKSFDKNKFKACPKCGESKLDCLLIGDEDTRVGYGFLWCDSCHHGVHLSRIEIPESVDMLPIDCGDDEIRKRMPEVKLVSD